MAWVNQGIREHNRRARELRRICLEQKVTKVKMRRQVRAWTKAVYDLETKLAEMRYKHRKDPASVTPEDWNAITAGQERKLQAICTKHFPLCRWPVGVPYLNMIALDNYRMAEKERIAMRTADRKLIELSITEQIEILEFETAQSEKQLLLLKKSRADPTSVSLVEWQIASHRTDAQKKDRVIAGYMELARRREMGESCDGWALGEYFGSP